MCIYIYMCVCTFLKGMYLGAYKLKYMSRTYFGLLFISA